MWAGNLVRARLLARKGIVDPTDFTSLLAWRLESNVSDAPDVPDVPDVPAELLSWEGVAYHINKGTYKDVYAIGDMIPLDLGSEGLINMQIAAFDTDTLANGSGTAAISWVAKELLATKRRMNPARSGSTGAYTEGTGTIGGWEKCELRAYLQNSIKPLIPSDVATLIAVVTKTQKAYNSGGGSYSTTTEDEVWIPDYDEIEEASSVYGGVMFDHTSRMKVSADGSSGIWWLRGAYNALKARSIIATGAQQSQSADAYHGICLGFCTGRTPT